MPIQFNEEKSAWELFEPTDAEKDALMELALEMMVNNFGEQVADKILEHANQSMLLNTIPTEGMARA